jgi:hypothetical protein
MPRNHCARAITCALSLACLAPLAATARADEGWAEVGWDRKWGSASIVYNRDAEPTDPSEGGATFRNSVGPFHFVSWELTTPKHFDGYGGTMITRNGQDPACHPLDMCPMISVLIQLGPLATGSPAQWEAHLFARGSLDDRGLPVLSSEGAPYFEGYLSNNLDDRRFGLGTGDYPHWHVAVAAPVPEPTSLALVGLGIGLLSMRCKRSVPPDTSVTRVGSPDNAPCAT